jgi:transmembrane sensor
MILGLAVVAAGALPFLLAEYWSTDYQTGPGEYLTISLEDRSRIELSGSTRVTVYFSALRRSVVLKQGEALFRVTHNSRHPFQVDVERARVTDLGTTFDVRRDSDGQVVVAVVEGTILVTTHQRTGAANVSASTRMGSNDHSAGIRVKAGEAVNMKPTGEVGPLHSVNVQEVTAWSGGVYAYRDTLLADVIADMQLHSARRIEYEPDAGKLVYTGLTDQNEPEVWVHGLPNILPVEVEDSDPDRLLIRCRSAGCKSR